MPNKTLPTHPGLPDIPRLHHISQDDLMTNAMSAYQKEELNQYAYVMQQIDSFGEHLEGMHYGISKAEGDFYNCSKIGISMIFIFMVLHQLLKFKRFQEN